MLCKSLIVAVLFALALWGLANQTGHVMDLLIEQEGRLRTLRHDSPIGLFVTAFAVYFVACFVPGTNGKAFICGWLFGILAGAVLINGASMLAALLMFYVARHFLRSHFESRYTVQLLNIKERIERDGGAYLFALRVVPIVPYTVLNALMGVTPLRTRTFWWSTQLGMLPSNFAFAWLGASLPDLHDLQQKGWTAMINWQLLSSLLLLGLLPIIAQYVIRIAKARRM